MGLLLAIGPAGCAGPKPPRNLLLVVVDTLRRDHVGAFGYPRSVTPAIDRLAREGAAIEALTPTPWTRPAMASLFTGLHPLRHQVATANDRLPPDAKTLAEVLRQAGFSTRGLSTNQHVAKVWGFDAGFERFDEAWRLGLDRFPRADRVNALFLGDLGALRQPFFLYLHYMDPHMPYDPPEGWDGKPLSGRARTAAPLRRGPGYIEGEAVDPELLRTAVDLYDGDVRWADRALDEVLRSLDRLGLGATTLVVVLSDHGEEFFEHGRAGHGRSLHAETREVPIVVRAPGAVPAGMRLAGMTLEDVAPTILDLLRVDGAARRGFDPDGRSFARRLAGGAQSPEPRDELLYLEAEEAQLGLVRGDRALLLGRRPYVKELYDLAADPGESTNSCRWGEGPPGDLGALARALAGEYDRLLARAHERHSGFMDEDLYRDLAALGYLDILKRGGRERFFPRRLAPADDVAGGLRGWEDPSRISACVDAGDATEDQLLAGWYGPEGKGRWTEPIATFAMPAAAARPPATLVLDGTSFRPGDFRLEVDALDGGSRTAVLPPGDFQIRVPFPAAARNGWVFFRLVATPAFRPADAGHADRRSLGTFVRRICRMTDEAPAEAQRR